MSRHVMGIHNCEIFAAFLVTLGIVKLTLHPAFCILHGGHEGSLVEQPRVPGVDLPVRLAT